MKERNVDLQLLICFCLEVAIGSGIQILNKTQLFCVASIGEDDRGVKEFAQALADLKFTYVVSCQVYGNQKKSSDARERSCYSNVLNLMLM